MLSPGRKRVDEGRAFEWKAKRWGGGCNGILHGQGEWESLGGVTRRRQNIGLTVNADCGAKGVPACFSNLSPRLSWDKSAPAGPHLVGADCSNGRPARPGCRVLVIAVPGLAGHLGTRFGVMTMRRHRAEPIGAKSRGALLDSSKQTQSSGRGSLENGPRRRQSKVHHAGRYCLGRWILIIESSASCLSCANLSLTMGIEC